VKVRLRRIFRNERGISPILATLLLIVIAVAAIIVTYAWITTYMDGATSHAGVYLKKIDVSWEAPNNITIIVKNIGTEDAYIDMILIGTSESELDPVPRDNVDFSTVNGFVEKRVE